MVNVELGTFLAFLAVPTLTLFFMTKIRSWQITGYVLFLGLGALSFIMLGGIALMFYFGYNIVLTQEASGYTTHGLAYDDLGNIIGNSTNEIPATTEITPVINAFQDIWALIFSGFTFVFGGIYFWVMIRGAT